MNISNRHGSFFRSRSLLQRACGLTLIGVIALATASLGCGGKVKECNKLISVINENGESIKTATAKMNAAKDDTKAIEEMATTMEKAADNIKTVELKDTQLLEFAKEYEEMLRSGAKGARDMVTAANNNDVAGITKAMGEVGRVETTESLLVNKINKYCRE